MVLHRKSKEIEHRIFSDLPSYLQAGDVLVLNNTKVIPARIMAQRSSGGAMEILLLKPEANRPGVWQAMANPLRKLKVSDRLRVETSAGQDFFISVIGFSEGADGQRRVLVDLGSNTEVYKLLSTIGQTPLPPYILREQANSNQAREANDIERYQTVYASAPGAVAAPTAGLHFSEELLKKLGDDGVTICYLTLHVGPGTFKPITSSIAEHTVESEEFYISAETAQTVNSRRRNGGKVFAVGTTSCRSLETAGASGLLDSYERGTSSLYIKPGHEFKMVDSLITNFHLSRSSLLVLVSAFAGHNFIMSAYKEAIAEQYRFYSYGDAMLIL
jgi:S-adenosylmethionine:tRNA ribosyltransferase-isomerase